MSFINNVDREKSTIAYKFYEAVKPLGLKNVKGTKLYDYQVEYCYLVNELAWAHYNTIHKSVAKLYRFIDAVSEEVRAA